jgi:iron complex outermembrane receptor protein
MGRVLLNSVLVAALFFALLSSALARSAQEGREVQDIGQIQVTAPKEMDEVSLSPSSETIYVEDYQTIEEVQNIGDIIKDLIIFDFRGTTDLVPDDDTFQMRGFESSRFVTAIDGLTLRKTGGRKASNIVDWSYLPPFLVERIEVFPGPHSALYPAKAIGGVLNMVSRTPKYHENLKPDIRMSTNYGSYDTTNSSVFVQGGVKSFTYDMGYQKYSTNGFLRNNEADIDTVFGRLGCVLPWDGHIAFTASYSDNDRQIPVVNDPSDAASSYNSNYPVVRKGTTTFYDYMDGTWDGIAFSYRFNYGQDTPIGKLSADAYYSEETKDRSYLATATTRTRTTMDTRYYQEGAKIQDEIAFSENHVTTIELDGAQLYDGDNNKGNKDKRAEIFGGGIQHKWQILPRLSLTAGLRFEDVAIRVSNSGITGQPAWIDREWNDWQPKSFLTYELDDLAAALRDTSVSLGVSRIWRAPDNHGDYNPQGAPAGAWLEPEHGVGWDAIVMRRLFGDITMKMDYSYYIIEDYIASNSQYAEYTPSRTNRVPAGLEYMDYKINLEEVIRQGIDLEFSGHIMKDLSFYLGYAYQELESQGDEPAGTAAASDRPKHRVNAGLRYSLFKNTTLLLDYQYQDEQVLEEEEQISEDEYIVTRTAIDAYHLVDLGVQQKLFEQWGPLHQGSLRLYMKNVFDEEYENSSGFPSTDRTIGIGFSVKM